MARRARWTGTGLVAAAAVAGAVGWWRNRAERPPFTLVRRDGAIEVRDYPALLVAETVQAGAREAALEAGFRTLADYIFATSRAGERIAMTAPVLSDRPDGAWRTRFFMPSRCDREELPETPPEVALETMPARRVAAIRFSGAADDAALAAREAELRAWIDASAHTASGEAEHAYYDAPFIPAPLRRNEVLVPLAA